MSEQKGKVDNIDKLVSHKLKTRRMILGLSQEEVGREIDVSIQQIQKYEKAKNRIACGKLFTLAKFLKVPINFFFTENTSDEYIQQTEVSSTNDNLIVSEKEIIQLIKSFNEIKNPQTRKKVIELIKSMSAL